MQKGFAVTYILAGILVLALVAGGALYLGTKNIQQLFIKTDEQVIPTIPSTQGQNVLPDKSSNILIEEIAYKPDSSWSTYIDNIAKFSIQYGPQQKVVDHKEGKNVVFLTCSEDTDKGQVCLSGFRIQVYNDYTGGSRREWLLKEFPSLKTYELSFEEVLVSGVKTLIVSANDPGSTSETYALMSKNNKMYMLAYPGGSKSKNEVKKVLSTFKFN